MLDIFSLPEQAEQQDGQHNLSVGNLHFPVSGKLVDVVNRVSAGSVIEWVSNGDWSMHELLLALLEKTGPATVHISSYAFSEKPARVIADLVHSKVITSLYCIIDSRVDTRSASALALIQNCAYRCRLIDTHAKVTVVANNQRQIVVIGSANYTVNHRYESGVIIESFESALFHQSWITDAIASTDK